MFEGDAACLLFATQTSFYLIKIQLPMFVLLITYTNMPLSMSMTSRAAPPSMGQWPGANISVVMELLCVLRCMGTEGMDNHG